MQNTLEPPGETAPLPRFWLLLLGLVFILSYSAQIWHLVERWFNEPDYSYGFFVPPFAAYLLWHRRDQMPRTSVRGGRMFGVLLLLAAGALQLTSVFLQFQLLDPFSMIPAIAGLVLVIWGWAGLAWAWPAILFLAFMVPLPGFIADRMAHPLQRIATICSTYVLQTVGVPATASGNVISLTDGEIGVVEACNGLRMLLTFFAITVAAFFLLERPLWERTVIVFSAPLIAVVSNVARIAFTGIVYETISPEAADVIFHDLAGWLMMPLAILLLMGEVALLTRLLPPAPEGPILHGVIGQRRPQTQS